MHRDLKSSSHGPIDSSGRSKIADFGMSRSQLDTSVMTALPAPFGWSSPDSTDAYSFGAILWELFTGAAPWAGYLPQELMCAVAVEGERLPLPAASETVPTAVREMIAACFSAPALRPPFSALSPALTARLWQHVLAAAPTVPPEHMCPLRLERLADPVRCADGHVYERAAIDSWLRASDASPVTHLPLRHR